MGTKGHAVRLFLMMTGLLMLLSPRGAAQDADVESDAPDMAQEHLDLLLEQCEHELFSCIMFEAMYADGDELSDDDLETVVLHHQACDSGSLLGCHFLGLKYRNGDVLVQNEERAGLLFALACAGGELRACHNLTPIEKEEETEEPEEETEEPEEESKGAPPMKPTSCSGCNCAGMLDLGGEGSGEEVSEEFSMEQKACFMEDFSACYNMGLMYLSGNGTAVNIGEAVNMFQTSCEGGEMLGCTNLGAMHANGQGVPQNDMQAVGLYHQACHGGEMIACNNLGMKYEKGEGVIKDDMKAASYFRKACNSGDLQSCYDLGMKYQSGEGVSQNDVQAAALFNQACQAGEIIGCEQATEAENIQFDGNTDDMLGNLKRILGFMGSKDKVNTQTWLTRGLMILVSLIAWFFMYRRFSRALS